jgi:VWFA-related protein
MIRLLAAAVASCLALQAPQRFSSGVELVTVDALVMNGRSPVGGLTAADFELRDNSVVQAIQQVSLEKLALRVALVLDVSGSVKGERLTNLQTAATSVISRLRTQDRASLSVFSHRLQNLVPLTDKREPLLAAIRGLEAGGGTALRDATFAALALRETTPGRTLVVLFSDGVDTSSFLSEADVTRAVQHSDAIVYPVGVRVVSPVLSQRPDPKRISANIDQEKRDTRFLREVADLSGGRLVFAEGNRDIGAAFARVMDEFNSRYVLVYSPTGPKVPGWHQIDLRLTTKKGTITARRGYLATR